MWWFYPDKIDEFGPVFRSILLDHAIPMWQQSLIPSAVLEILGWPERKYGNYPVVADPLRVEIVVHIDDGDPTALHRMSDEARRRFPAEKLLPWLRQRLDDRMAA
jgi:hypothetical protein